MPESRFNLVSNYVNSTTVAFQEPVIYECLPEHYFEVDYHLQSINATCLDNGTWSSPDWLQCIHHLERYCPDPPPAPMGGESNWDASKKNATPFGTQVTYNCLEARQLQKQLSDGTSLLYQSQVLKCEWNQTWSPTDKVLFL